VRKPFPPLSGLRQVANAIAEEPLLFLPLAVAAGLCAVLGVIVWFLMR
jgi:hypothetical protein